MFCKRISDHLSNSFLLLLCLYFRILNISVLFYFLSYISSFYIKYLGTYVDIYVSMHIYNYLLPNILQVYNYRSLLYYNFFYYPNLSMLIPYFSHISLFPVPMRHPILSEPRCRQFAFILNTIFPSFDNLSPKPYSSSFIIS